MPFIMNVKRKVIYELKKPRQLSKNNPDIAENLPRIYEKHAVSAIKR